MDGADTVIPFSSEKLSVFNKVDGLNKSITFSSKSTSSSEILKIDSNGIQLVVSTYHGKSITVYTDQKIDFSKYSKIYIGFKGTCGDGGTSGTLRFGTLESIPNNDNTFTDLIHNFNLAYNSTVYYSVSGHQCNHACIDISNINTIGYLKIRLDMVYWYYNAVIDQIILE